MKKLLIIFLLIIVWLIISYFIREGFGYGTINYWVASLLIFPYVLISHKIINRIK